jgi:hypothetical protein
MKRAGLLLALLPLLCAAETPRAEVCLTAEIETQDVEVPGRLLFRIEFRNACAESRTLFWCAEHPREAVPREVACPGREASPGAPAPSVLVSKRRTFQWLMPAGARIRYVDCPASTRPTLGLGCAAAY